MKKIPKPTVERYCRLYSFLEDLDKKGVEKVQSSELGQLLGVPGFTIRKDLSFIGRDGESTRSYNVVKLKELIGSYFQFDKKRNACVVGLGRIGSALLAYSNFEPQGFNIVAGFEDSINRLELIKSDINVYPVYQLEDVIVREKIEIALVAVPADSAQNVTDRLVTAGVNGVLNFAPVFLSVPQHIVVKNVDLTNMLREIVAFKELNIQ
ncbi:MAG: redox-sensing transcriptional repressor Rex [Candidatus Ancaeobacter aquaticus]|nr:redox-sensing transcriptional repressor Rex [Candidatus Ancaeobacter aquaticus]